MAAPGCASWLAKIAVAMSAASAARTIAIATGELGFATGSTPYKWLAALAVARCSSRASRLFALVPTSSTCRCRLRYSCVLASATCTWSSRPAGTAEALALFATEEAPASEEDAAFGRQFHRESRAAGVEPPPTVDR
ncbi:hypothetical protein GCM10010170_099940 [Dactylosporangium salmoneum]|uniref:Secreted protein n=1 Tax=Dactylosporangium salmoneum TaxID=53361 RepID=A0ABP5UZ46_9ACTN